MTFRALLLPALTSLALLAQAPAPKPAGSEPKPAPAAKPADAVPPARISLTTPFPVHLGSVGPREVRDAVYGIKSLHDRPFHFKLMDLSLGLSLDEAQFKDPIQPGEVRMVHVKVDPTGLLGYIRGAIRLGTDDPTQPFYILRYDMMVRPELTVDAPRKDLGDVAPYESPTADFKFTREGGEPVKVQLASPLPPYFESEVSSEGTTADLRLTFRPSRLAPGTMSGLEVLRVTTNAPKQPEFTLYLDWRLALPVMPTPARLVYDDLKTTLLAVDLRSKDGKPFRIVSARVEGKGFELLDSPGPAAAQQTLRVRRTGRVPSAMLVLQFEGIDTPLRVPLLFLDPNARGNAPAPASSGTH